MRHVWSLTSTLVSIYGPLHWGFLYGLFPTQHCFLFLALGPRPPSHHLLFCLLLETQQWSLLIQIESDSFLHSYLRSLSGSHLEHIVKSFIPPSKLISSTQYFPYQPALLFKVNIFILVSWPSWDLLINFANLRLQKEMANVCSHLPQHTECASSLLVKVCFST